MKKIQFDSNLKSNYYLADYFDKTRFILISDNKDRIVTMQWFQRKEHSILCGIEYVIQLLKFIIPNYNNLKIQALKDGDVIEPSEPVLKITGKYSEFAFLEGLIDGILARATSIATNSRRIVDAANGKKVINMNDRADFFANQELDGYASYIGGIRTFVTESAIKYIDDINVKKPQGTMPHALIACYNGNVIEASKAFLKYFPQNDLVVLVDYNNDCINDSLKVANYFKKDLRAVRVDTSDSLIDKSLEKYNGSEKINGVNPTLIKKLRAKLDQNGHSNVKIIVSSGFDEQKIKIFEFENTPVDVYGVGEAITRNKINFTGDIVMVDGEAQSKIGRKNIVSNKLKDII